jgi:hypothetical protein
MQSEGRRAGVGKRGLNEKGSCPRGIGALAFAILPMIAFSIANPPGGNYSLSDITSYVTKGHRTDVFVSLYVILLSAVGLALLLARLRDSVEENRRPLFWGLGVSAVAAWMIGYALAAAVPVAMAFGGAGHVILTNPTIFTFTEAGFGVMFGAGGLVLGCALVVFAVGPVSEPAWVRWTTLVAGIAALAGLAWFPFFVVYVWSLLLGVRLLATARVRAPETRAQTA